ncbi:sulfurtransferase [Sinisalibacter lacisalsi]|uniref:Sulfurtransferase n=1 Tax=Sinisalibacter lacisalsi TaxID=1526570 RepID=A0ABQ1QBE4_9RHOB|nr:sulfurtransferase [Sinisalibacter lacisalsi]GGD21991.1 sulfurtransferase [Sinisalibacter lacisalsi]
MKSMVKKMKAMMASMAIMVMAGIAGPAMAADPLVDVAWVKENIGKDGVVFVDARGQTDYLRGHIPGAVNTDYGKSGWRVAKDGIPGVFPDDPSDLAAHIGSLGIDNDTHVVLVAPGSSSSDMGTATRMYWSFKVLGHDEVSVLNGGMAAYLSEVDGDKNPVNPLEKGMPEIAAKTFNVALREDMLLNEEDVQAAADSGALMVDNRTADQYLGVNRHGAAKASGTIPGAVNLPQSWMTDNGGGMFRDSDTLAKLYQAAGVPTEGDQVSFCNTGHWASIGWFVSSEILGNKDAKMYDGSMVAWTNKAMPMEAQIAAE